MLIFFLNARVQRFNKREIIMMIKTQHYANLYNNILCLVEDYNEKKNK